MNFGKLTAYLDSLEEKYGVPGVDCKVIRDHETIYRHMTGFSDYEKTKPVSQADLYDIYSMSKIATMTAVMQLIERGEIDLGDDVTKYLPEFAEMYYDPNFKFGWPMVMPTRETATKKAENPIKIWNLMSMTAGLGYDINSEPIKELQKATDNKGSTREFVKAIAATPLLWEPNTRYGYSLAHDVLAGVVEVVSGMTFGEYMKKNIFEPLGMKEIWYQVPKAEAYRLAAQYSVSFQTGEITRQEGNAFRLSENYESGGAGVTTSVDEYSKLLDALACGGVGATGERILKEESVLEFTKNRLTPEQVQQFQMGMRLGYGYGLGMRVYMGPEGAKSPVGEFGWDGAAGAYALIDPFNHISIYYGQQVLGMIKSYAEIHPAVRDLVYEALEEE